MAQIKLCPVCGKPFAVTESARVVCSVYCHEIFHTLHTASERKAMIRETEGKRRSPHTDCRAYVAPGVCRGLNGMWCEWEDCKFYKPKGARLNDVENLV